MFRLRQGSRIRVLGISVLVICALGLVGAFLYRNLWQLQRLEVTLKPHRVGHIRHETLSCLTSQRLQSLREQPTLINPLFDTCHTELVNDLGPEFSKLTDEERFLIFSSIVAYALAPYGTSYAIELPDLLKASHLACDNYTILAVRLFRLSRYKTHQETKRYFIGWDGGIVGNHAQLLVQYKGTKRSILLDPTIAVVALTDFNSMASGKPVERQKIVDFSFRQDLQTFRHRVIKALVLGLYKPSDLLYYFEGLKHFLDPQVGAAQYWMTPGAISLRNGQQKL